MIQSGCAQPHAQKVKQRSRNLERGTKAEELVDSALTVSAPTSARDATYVTAPRDNSQTGDGVGILDCRHLVCETQEAFLQTGRVNGRLPPTGSLLP
jgi:hypothetical protein